MDGISAAASVLAVGTAGVKISIKLVAFANQVATASERVRSIAIDISLTANVLQQLGELMSKPEQDEAVSIFSEEGLATTQASVAACEEVFRDLEVVLNKANGQFRIKAAGIALGKKITLSKIEALKWPFLQPGVDSLRTTLNNARENLMLILHVTTLAYMKKLAELHYPSAPSLSEQSQQVSAILALRRSPAALVPTTAVIPHEIPHSALKDNRLALDSPTLDSSHVCSQNCATEPSPPEPPLIDTSIRSTGDTCASQDRQEKIPTTAFTAGSLREAHVAIPGARNTTGFGEKPTQSAQHGQKDQNSAKRSSSALSYEKYSSKHRQAVDNSSELSKSIEVWLVEPRISKAEDHNGYDIKWERICQLLSPSEFKDEHRDLRRPFWQRKRSVREQFANLSQTERQVLLQFLTEENSGLPGNTSMKSIKLMKMRPAREPITRMPWRCIHVLVERTDMNDHPQSHQPWYAHHDRAQYLQRQQIQGHIPVPPFHRFHGPHQQLDHHADHDPGVELSVAQSSDVSYGSDPSDADEEDNPLEDRVQMRSAAVFSSNAIHRAARSSDLLFPSSSLHELQSGHGRPAAVCSHEDSFRDTRPEARNDTGQSYPFSTGINSSTEVPEALTPILEDVGDMQDSEYENEEQGAGDPRSEELSAETSQRVIDELLAKYTTIFS